MENEIKSVFNELSKIDVNDYVENKDGLSYLSWANAIQELCKLHDIDFDYEIEKFGENQLPYVYDDATGFMVFTRIRLCGKVREMWLPVMDGKNKAMKKEAYEYDTKFGKKRVEPATMFDINKTIMRCLTKNIAMFGLGLYIYAGEDLPEGAIPKHWSEELYNRAKELEIDFDKLALYLGKDKYQITNDDLTKAISKKETMMKKTNIDNVEV